jgi:hypothetical protein
MTFESTPELVHNFSCIIAVTRSLYSCLQCLAAATPIWLVSRILETLKVRSRCLYLRRASPIWRHPGSNYYIGVAVTPPSRFAACPAFNVRKIANIETDRRFAAAILALSPRPRPCLGLSPLILVFHLLFTFPILSPTVRPLHLFNDSRTLLLWISRGRRKGCFPSVYHGPRDCTLPGSPSRPNKEQDTVIRLFLSFLTPTPRALLGLLPCTTSPNYVGSPPRGALVDVSTRELLLRPSLLSGFSQQAGTPGMWASLNPKFQTLTFTGPPLNIHREAYGERKHRVALQKKMDGLL